ncbi:MAG: hypothetical protein ACRERV_01310 [Methylococcales bacterium]
MDHNLLTLASDPQPGEPLLQPVMQSCNYLTQSEPLATIRARLVDQLARLPEAFKSIHANARYSVQIGEALNGLAERMAREDLITTE